MLPALRYGVAMGLLPLLAACGEGGRGLPARAGEATPPPAQDAPGQAGPLDPVGEALEPLGLGYRVDTVFGSGPDAIEARAYGVDGLPLALDVDGDPDTGNALGADIVVHFFTLLLRAELSVRPLDGAPSPLPLKLEVTVLDPRNLLGLPGLAGLTDPDLRVALGYDAREDGAPARYRQRLTALDSLLEFLPRFTRAEMDTEIEGARGPVVATLALFAERGSRRADGLELSLDTRPTASSQLTLQLAPEARQSELSLAVDRPSEVGLGIDSYEGAVDTPLARRDVQLRLAELEDHFALTLDGVDDASLTEGRHYRLETTAPVGRAQAELDELTRDGERRVARLELTALPTRLELTRGPERALDLLASAPIADLAFARSENGDIAWAEGLDPATPFTAHRVERRQSGAGDSLQVRLAGLQRFAGRFDDVVSVSAALQAAPLRLREEHPAGFLDATLARLPAEFELVFPSEGDDLEFRYRADSSGPGLEFREEDGGTVTEASLRPLPASLELCSSSDDRCGSHGQSTDISLQFAASEAVTINFHRRRADGRKETRIEELQLTRLAIDAGTRSGGRRGYVYFDTDGLPYSGRYWQKSGDDGLALEFSPGTWAEDRRVSYKDYVRINNRSGRMQCPGHRSLEVRARGSWFDADFILDALCE